MNIETQILPYSSSRLGQKPKVIVVHWSGGVSLDSAIATLKQRNLSYHYIIDGERVVNLVDDSRAAYHAGVWTTNLQSLGVCFVGTYERAIDPQSYESGARLLAILSKRHNIELTDATVRPHNAFKATACPGTLDRLRLIGEARQILNPPPFTTSGTNMDILPSVAGTIPGTVTYSIPVPGDVTVKVRSVYVRAAADHRAAQAGMRYLRKGQKFFPVEQVTGSDPYGDGRNQWYRNVNNEYVWTGAF